MLEKDGKYGGEKSHYKKKKNEKASIISPKRSVSQKLLLLLLFLFLSGIHQIIKFQRRSYITIAILKEDDRKTRIQVRVSSDYDQHNNSKKKKRVRNVRNAQPKLIAPGNHTNVPPPESIIGPNGEKGYVHNPKFLIERPKPFHIPQQQRDTICVPPGKGSELPKGYAALRKIRQYMETSQEDRDVTLFCAVYTYSGGEKYTNAASETWAKRCDGVLFASDNTNTTTGHVRIPSNSRRGSFDYQGMVQRTRAILAYLYDNFLDDYDFFHISGDDVFLIVENLKEFLASEKVQNWEKVSNQYVFAGFIMVAENIPYLGGGSGYTLSKKALQAFVEGPMQTCNTHKEGSAEDVRVAECAALLNKNFTIDTRDSVGAHRYHQLSVQRHATFPEIRWGFSTHLMHLSLKYQEENFGYPELVMDDYISNSSVAFHKHSVEEIRRLEILLYMDGNETCHETFSTCPQQPDASVDDNFPIGFPQNLTFGRFRGQSSQSAEPFISSDIWTDLVDNKRTFFLRPVDKGFPPIEQLRDWIRSRPHPITLVINNQHDRSWPDDLNNKTYYELILNETNIHAVYAGNARYLKEFPKLKPIPIGLKFNWRSTLLFSEDKKPMMKTYTSHLATSAKEAEALFKIEDRTSTVWLRPMTNSNRGGKYVRDNQALKLRRSGICEILNRTAPETGVCTSDKMDQEEYFELLKTHQFVLSPAGGGLDTHGTWEALLAGCIPIVPRSPLDPLFEDLPVWLVDSWEEVTDEAVDKNGKKMKNKAYNWEKLFAPWWKEQIHKGLCDVES